MELIADTVDPLAALLVPLQHQLAPARSHDATDGHDFLVLAGRKSAFVAEEREQRRELEAGRAGLVGEQGAIIRFQRPLGRQFIVFPQALHRT